MKRRLFSLAAATSLMLCLAVITLWARSLHHADRLAHAGPYDAWSNHRYCFLMSQHGGLRLLVGARQRFPLDEEDGIGPGTHFRTYRKGQSRRYGAEGWPTFDDVQRFGHARFGFAYVDTQEGYPKGNLGYRYRAIVVPDWFIIGLGALLPARWLMVRYREGRRQRDGACRVCGYDLRATPHRCPECGTVVSHGDAAA